MDVFVQDTVERLKRRLYLCKLNKTQLYNHFSKLALYNK